jgi:GNAT superfamily N-acetyltransferase
MSGAATLDITRPGPADLDRLSGTLAQAFHDDPVLRWVIPDSTHRRARLPALFAAEAEAYLRLGETFVAGDGAGAALWAPAGTQAVTEDQLEAYGARIAAILREDADRAVQVQTLMEQHHPSHPCYHLQWLGVVPEHQRRGLGSRLLTPVLEQCDATGTPAYLEATSRRNAGLYARHGFEVRAIIEAPDYPEIILMRRPARAGRS